MSENTNPDIGELRADIEQTREELAQTVDQLTAKLDVKHRVHERITEVQDQMTGPDGRPTTQTWSIAGGAIAVVLTLVALKIWRRRSSK